jgi:hypothetical protein
VNLHSAGFHGSDSDLIAAGERICDDLRQGYSIVTLHRAFEQEGLSRQQAIYLVNSSYSFLCPGTGTFE